MSTRRSREHFVLSFLVALARSGVKGQSPSMVTHAENEDWVRQAYDLWGIVAEREAILDGRGVDPQSQAPRAASDFSCSYPNCDCAVELAVGVEPTTPTACPRI